MHRPFILGNCEDESGKIPLAKFGFNRINSGDATVWGVSVVVNVQYDAGSLSRRSLNPADIAFMDGRKFLDIQTSGEKIRLIQPDFSLVRELYARHIYFPEPVFVPPAGSKVIDMGANVGFFSLPLRQTMC